MSYEGRDGPNTTKSWPSSAACQRIAIKMAFRWPAYDYPPLNAVIFQGIGTSIAKEPCSFVIFKGGADPCPPSGLAHDSGYQT